MPPARLPLTGLCHTRLLAAHLQQLPLLLCHHAGLQRCGQELAVRRSPRLVHRSLEAVADEGLQRLVLVGQHAMEHLGELQPADNRGMMRKTESGGESGVVADVAALRRRTAA